MPERKPPRRPTTGGAGNPRTRRPKVAGHNRPDREETEETTPREGEASEQAAAEQTDATAERAEQSETAEPEASTDRADSGRDPESADAEGAERDTERDTEDAPADQRLGAEQSHSTEQSERTEQAQSAAESEGEPESENTAEDGQASTRSDSGQDEESSDTSDVTSSTAKLSDVGTGSTGSTGEQEVRPPRHVERKKQDGKGRRRSRKLLNGSPYSVAAALVVIAVLCAGLGVWFRGEAQADRVGGGTNNSALVDPAATSEVIGQISKAVESTFSYNFADTGKTDQAAKKLLTGQAVDQYNKLFGTVRKLAPKQKMVLTTTVKSIGVKQLQGNRASLLVFVDQQAVRTDNKQNNTGPAQISVNAVKQGGQWKISSIQPR